MIVIAEVKTKSPFGFQSDLSWDELFEIANEVGDWIAIHTDPRWGGRLHLISKARSKTDKPIVAKGLHTNDRWVEQCFKYGADYVTVVGRISELPNTIYEPLHINDLRSRFPERIDKMLWNQRHLGTGGRKAIPFYEARQAWSGWLCQGSFIKTWDDVDPQANAILVGEHLPTFAGLVTQ